jgi:hypothetical protein
MSRGPRSGVMAACLRSTALRLLAARLRLMGQGALCCLALSLAGCRSLPASFHCHADAQCALGSAAGRCEATSFCSFADRSCPSGRRYSHSGDALGDRCVDDGVTAADAAVALDLGEPADASLVVDAAADLISAPAADGDGGGLIAGQVSPTRPAQLDLTQEGTIDWSHWSPSVFDHKRAAVSYISDCTPIGINSVYIHNDELTAFSWSDGTPNLNVSGTHFGIAISGPDNGCSFRIKAEPVEHVLRLYVGGSDATTRLTASLSDGSAAPYIDESLARSRVGFWGTYTIRYRSASPNAVLAVRWEMTSGAGVVSVGAATLH